MLVDLHAHYPMHVIPDGRGHAGVPLRRWRTERWRARLVDVISRVANYQGPGDQPSVTVRQLRDGDVGVALSVLYAPFDEIDLELDYGAPPRPGYVDHVLDQIAAVEDEVATHPDARVVHDRAELDAALRDDVVALVHCVEGGFALGSTEQQVRDNVAALAARGVGYVTLAHLFWRQVATNAPALPFLPDRLYRLLFPQPGQTGLAPLGRAAVRAMVDHHVLIDVTHMSERALRDTLDLLDELDPDGRVPVIASHGAARFGGLAYNLPDDVIARLARRGGVVGLIACTHYVAAGLQPKRPKGLDDSVALLCRHVDRIRELTGSHEHAGIGSDLDGYIKPALPGLEQERDMRDLQARLRSRYGAEDAERLTSGNALRVLRYRFP